VFAHGRLDRGTAVLLRSAQPSTEARTFLDLGCGYGPIACALAVAVPGSEIWAVDVNRRALHLTSENATALGIGARVRPREPDDLPEDVVFDEIWSNPPIRVGKEALHELLARWLPRLRPAGRALLVVGKNLGADSLQRWLRAEGYSCERLASAKGFRVLEVGRPPPAASVR
jgi:16S rRNA G1207 methylase RsmC